MADDPKKNISTNYKIDCLGCHIPAQKTDWVFQHGYPMLNETDGQLKKYKESIYTGDEEIDMPEPDPKKLDNSTAPKQP